MHKTILFIAAIVSVSWASAQVQVRPYVRNDGFVVPGHIRTAPDSTVDNNYGTRGNYNPFTGQQGSELPSYERPQPAPRQQTCGVNRAGLYVCN